MVTYKFYIDKRTVDAKTGLGSVKLRLINNRKKAEIGIGIQAKESILEDALSQEPTSKAKHLSLFLSTRRVQIERVIMGLLDSGQKDIDVKELCSMVKEALKIEEKTPDTFTSWFKKFVDGKGNEGTKGVYRHTLDRIRLYDPDIDRRTFEDIDLKWLTGFEAFCAKTASKNARNIHLRNIRAVFNYAIDYDVTTAYPFRRFKIRPEETRKRSLTVDELRRLFDYPVEEYAEIYRDMFKLIFLLIGINTVDLHGLKAVTKDGRIEYKRAKTGKLYSIKVEPEAMEIIEKYQGNTGLLCITDRWSDSRNFRHQCNKALQKIGQVERKGRGGKKIIDAEFESLTTYWARHSWATIAYELGISKDIIAQALGHSDGHDTTNIYIREDMRKVDEANRRVLDWVLYGNG